jgi:isocitrate dehydrogenase
MRHPSTPSSNGHSDAQPQRSRTRGAIRTHLGRKRTGPRARATSEAPTLHILSVEEMQQRQDEDLFDRLRGQFQSIFDTASEKTLSAFDSALDTACQTVVSAGEFTAEGAQRVRDYLRRDLLHHEQPALTFRTGDITSAGVLVCENCEWTLQTSRTTLLPPCPHCGETIFRKAA